MYKIGKENIESFLFIQEDYINKSAELNED